MAIRSVHPIIAGLEFSPLPHLLVQEGHVIGATSSCVKLLECDHENEIRNSYIKEWIVDYDPNMPPSHVVKVHCKAGSFFQALVARHNVDFCGRNVEVISIDRFSEPQMQKTAEDLNLLSHVLNPSLTQLHEFLDGTSDQEGNEFPRLRRMSSDLSDGVTKFRFYKILENGSIVNSLSRFNPREQLMQIIEAKAALHQDKWEIKAQMPLFMDKVVLDQEKFRFIIEEVLQNAIVHNSGGRINLCATEESFLGRRHLVIVIQDNGKGFVWPEGSETCSGSPVKRSHSGGVGLSICTTFAEAMQGKLEIVSGEGNGAMVRLTLPCAISSDAMAKTEFGQSSIGIGTRDRAVSAPVCKSPLMISSSEVKPYVSAINSPRSVEEKAAPIQFKYHALVVEDNLVNSKVLSRLLEGFGLTCDVAENGLVAVQKMRANPKAYDLIFMDLLMPQMGGLEATSIIQTICEESQVQVPIFACTANTEDDQQCLDAKMMGVIHKPVKKDALLKALVTVAESK
ncbi:MAG: response regulator [Verrucomicrobia bacterium]|nr:response regulator [Verrucomicrobiota bacterium]